MYTYIYMYTYIHMYKTIFIWYNIGYTMVHSKGFNRKHDHTRVAHDALEDPDFD